MAKILGNPRFFALKDDGSFAAGWKLYSYSSGTTSLLDTYSDQTQASPNSNPIILDGAGSADVWLATGVAYKLVLTDDSDVVQWTEDGINQTDAGVFTTLTANSANIGTISAGTVSGSFSGPIGVSSANVGFFTAVSQTGKTTKYNNVVTIGNGLAAVEATADLTAQGADVGPTTFYTAPEDGFYRISASIFVTRVATSSSTLPDLKVTYTHVDNNTSQSVAAFAGSTGNALTTGGGASFAVYAKSGTNIQYQTGASTAYASSGASSMQFSLHLKVEHIG